MIKNNHGWFGIETISGFDNRLIRKKSKKMERTEEEIRYDERMRIAKELRRRPFGWCSVCSDIPCKCTI